MAYQPHPKDEKDVATGVIRGRYLAPDKLNRDTSWLVYDNAGDTCGAVTPGPTGKFGAFSRGKLKSIHDTVREAIAALLSASERKEFNG